MIVTNAHHDRALLDPTSDWAHLFARPQNCDPRLCQRPHHAHRQEGWRQTDDIRAVRQNSMLRPENALGALRTE
jgi:hypothetical protein